MKRITIIMVLALILSMTIGCNGGNGESKLVKISISPKDVTLFLGEEKAFTAVVSGASDQQVTWSATGGEIDDDGLYRATELGTFKVKAASKADPSKTATATVNVLSPMGDFSDVTAWVGTVTWKVNGSWSSSGVGTWEHRINENITRKYRLEDKGYNKWRRRLNSEVMVSGAIDSKSIDSTGCYGEIKWSGAITVVPDTHDYLSIDEAEGTYTIELDVIDASPIPNGIYDSDGEPFETWDFVWLEEILIANQPLPQTGTTLAGSKVEKRLIAPVWGEGDSSESKELDVTITWSFTPLK